MELEVNKSHKKIDLSHIKKPLVRFTAGTLVSLCIFSGMANTNAKVDVEIPPAPVEITEVVDNEDMVYEETILENVDYKVAVPEKYRFNILFQVNKTEVDEIYASDLQQIEYLNISVDKEEDFSFLKHCTNLKQLQITCLSENSIDYISNIPTIKSLESLSLYNIFLDLELNDKNIVFLENNPSIKYLELDGILLVPGIEEELNKLDTLRLSNSLNVDIDFSKLTELKHLDLIETEPYTLAMHLNTNEYNTLIEHGVEINLDEEYKTMFLRANEKLDEIVKELNVTNESTDREKLDAILLYTLTHLTYDPTIANIPMEELRNTNLAQEFYQNGLLFGALEKDTAICGNYTALVEALSDRLGNPSDSFYMTSNTHAWNLMNIDGELFYVDSTWLDDFEIINVPKIASGDGEQLKWYTESPETLNVLTLDPNGNHIPVVEIPSYMKKDIDDYMIDYDTENNQVLASTTKVNVKIKDQEVETNLGSIIGAMVAFGLAVSVTNKKNKKVNEEEKDKNNQK